MLGRKPIAGLSAIVVRSSYKMPMLATLLFAFVFGTFVAGGMSLIAPSPDQQKSSYSVMGAFFETQRKAIKESELPVLLRLNTRKLAPSAIKHSMNVAGVSTGTIRVSVHYFRPKKNAQGALRLTLTDGADDARNASIMSASILPSREPIRLEFRVEGQQINLDLERSRENSGAKWPRTIISVVQVPDE